MIALVPPGKGNRGNVAWLIYPPQTQPIRNLRAVDCRVERVVVGFSRFSSTMQDFKLDWTIESALLLFVTCR
jgi:hypothetical protein